jgi:hypothetical protein
MEDVPDEFRPWLEPGGGASEGEVPTELARRGLVALSEAAGRPGRDREAAFRLLAADAYITYACEAALEDTEPERAPEELVGRIAAGTE